MSNYTKENLIAIPPTAVPAGTLAMKVGDEIFTPGNIKISNTSDTGVRSAVYVATDARFRWFGVDCREIIAEVQEYQTYGVALAINGKAFRVYGPQNDSQEYTCIPVTDMPGITSVVPGNGFYIYLTAAGGLYTCTTSLTATDSIPFELNQIASGVDFVTSTPGGHFWYKSGNAATLTSLTEGTPGSIGGIARIISRQAGSWNYGSGYAVYALSTSGELMALYREGESEQTAKSSVLCGPPSASTSWRDVAFYPYESYGEGGGCYIFATDSAGNLFYAKNSSSGIEQLSSLTFTQASQLSGAISEPGYCVTELSYNWDEETGEETATASESTVALAIDGEGRLWKLAAAISGSSLSGITATQIGTDTDWRYTQPTITRNNKAIAQKGDQMVLLRASNTNVIDITATPLREVSGVISCVYSTQNGYWVAIVQPGT